MFLLAVARAAVAWLGSSSWVGFEVWLWLWFCWYSSGYFAKILQPAAEEACAVM